MQEMMKRVTQGVKLGTLVGIAGGVGVGRALRRHVVMTDDCAVLPKHGSLPFAPNVGLMRRQGKSDIIGNIWRYEMAVVMRAEELLLEGRKVQKRFFHPSTHVKLDADMFIEAARAQMAAEEEARYDV